MVKKIVFIGPAAAGKTSIRKFFFEATPADTLLATSEPATIGMKFKEYEYVYTYPVEPANAGERERIPMKLALIDSAGQQINDWLGPQKEMLFNGADILFFIFDVSCWLDSGGKQQCLEHVRKIMEIKRQLAASANFYILAHKFDTIASTVDAPRELVSKIRQDISDYIFDTMKLMLQFDVSLTSLEKEFRKDTFFLLLEKTTNILGKLL
ncbi:hypothetical protein GF325_14825 [Candidatus Bathyarchaeota archaeon]|nr:hypothetical protein [Candidatus Bathyarchaeota archaeon]